MTAELPTARVEIAHRADPQAGEEVITMTLRAQPSLDAASMLFGPAAAGALLSLGAPMTGAGGASPDTGGPAAAFGDPMKMWTDAWMQWMAMWTAPLTAFGAPTLCGTPRPAASKKQPD